MGNIDFLKLNDVLLAHEDQTSRYGGDPSIRDLGLLESALAQPQAAFGGKYLHEFPFEMAAAYLFHIVLNHPFVDGNKRAGAVAALLFLEINGIVVNPPKGSVYKLTLSVANGQIEKPEIAEFLRTHSVAA